MPKLEKKLKADILKDLYNSIYRRGKIIIMKVHIHNVHVQNYIILIFFLLIKSIWGQK